jgi:hypothetical protein
MTVLDLIQSAMRLANILGTGETASAVEANQAFDSLNDMIDTWSTEQLLIYAKAYETFPLVVNQQSYQMGNGAPDFNSSSGRPLKIEDINFQQVSGTTTVELPIDILSQDQWAAISVKTVTSNLPTKMWPEFTFPYTTLNFWPIPTVSNNVIIWSWKPLSDFTNLAAVIALPPGYNKALRYNLAVELAPEYGKTLDPVIISQATNSKAAIKRMNSRVDLMGVDDALLPQRSTWNWFTGE